MQNLVKLLLRQLPRTLLLGSVLFGGPFYSYAQNSCKDVFDFAKNKKIERLNTVPEVPRSSTDSWDKTIGEFWFATVKKLGTPRTGVIVEIGPGGRGKVGYGLSKYNFEGILYVIELDSQALQQTLSIYKTLMPHAEIIGISKPFQLATGEIKQRPDAILANHLLDDLITYEASSEEMRSRIFTNCYTTCSLNAAKELWSQLKKTPSQIEDARAKVKRDFLDFVQVTGAQHVGLSQYDSKTFKDHGLVDPDQHAQILLKEISSYLSSKFDLSHLTEIKTIGLQPTTWLLAKRKYIPENLAEAAALRTKEDSESRLYIEIQGIRVPRKSANSKWRAVFVRENEDQISEDGYKSGWVRFGNKISEWLKSKYRDAKGSIDYRFSDGRQVKVSAKVARALEFSYLDSLNPYSPKNSIVIGIHDDLPTIIEMVRQSQAEKLGQPGGYFRIDEISTEGLEITSSEDLYKEYGLKSRVYSPKGEWVVDSSIPAENIISTLKFKQLYGKTSLQELATKKPEYQFKVGEEVYYQAMNGEKYVGVVARDYIIDGFLIVTYHNRYGQLSYDLGHVQYAKKSTKINKNLPFDFNLSAIHHELNRNPESLVPLLELLSSDPDIGFLIKSSSGTAKRESIGTHSAKVYSTFKEFEDRNPILRSFKTKGGLTLSKFLAMVIAVHDIGKSIAGAHAGIEKQKEYNTPLALRILSQLSMQKSDLELAKAIIDHDDFGRLFNARTPQDQKLKPDQLIEIISRRATELRISPRLLYALNLVFYLADAGSYDVVRNNYFHIDSSNRLVPKNPDFEILEKIAAKLP